MLRYFHRVWHRWQKEHHGRETEQKETRANMKHHFSGTKWTGGLCQGRQTDRGHEWNLSPTWPEVSFRYFLVWRECLPCPPHPSPSLPLLPSPLLLSPNDQPTTSSLPSYPCDKIYRKSCRSSRPVWDLPSVVVHFVELYRHREKLRFQKGNFPDYQSFCHTEALKLLSSPWAWAFKVIFHSDDYRQVNRQRERGLK